MSDGDAYVPTEVTVVDADHEQPSQKHEKHNGASLEIPLEEQTTNVPGSRMAASVPFQRHHALNLEDYFAGPRDMDKHSKWPLFMQMHGSILPKMIVPLIWMSAWSACITCIYEVAKKNIAVNSILLTVLGFVVSTGLSFRGSTAYERYAEGRRFFAAIVTSSQALGRIFWIHAKILPNVDVRKQILYKISAMNLVVAYAIALKHSLRFEPYIAYQDIEHLVGHLDTFAKSATATMPVNGGVGRKNFFKHIGDYLGLSFAASNPRKQLKKAEKPLGNLPLEILNHLAVTIDDMIARGQLTVPMQQTLAYNNLAALNDAVTGCHRVLNTPLPIAYGILFQQITWLYVVLLPFQMVAVLHWITIPATTVASYIILGLLFIGQEIENPFGHDVNDLPLDSYCEQIALDMDIIASHDAPKPEDFFFSSENIPLWPVSAAPASTWLDRSETKLKETIRTRPNKTFEWRRWKGAKIGDEESGKTD
ncbi:Bestrophin, RFP-TM, chloride channel domain-containing protein [Trichoderma chlorosporum]